MFFDSVDRAIHRNTTYFSHFGQESDTKTLIYDMYARHQPVLSYP